MVQEHLDGCGICAEEYRFEASVLRWVGRSLNEVQVPEDLFERVSGALAGSVVDIWAAPPDREDALNSPTFSVTLGNFIVKNFEPFCFSARKFSALSQLLTAVPKQGVSRGSQAMSRPGNAGDANGQWENSHSCTARYRRSSRPPASSL